MKLPTVILSVFLCGLWTLPAAAIDMNAPVPGMQDFFRTVGGYTKTTRTGEAAYVEIVLHKETIIRNFNELLASGVFASDLGETANSSLPMKQCFYVGEQAAELAIIDLFRSSDVKHAHLIVEIIVPDNFGNDKFGKMFSFDFDRTLFGKINWQQFNPRNFSKITIGFAASNWFYEVLSNEQNGYPIQPPE